jgi:predicted nuclease of predicted toxin-antitoxin system
VRVFVDENIPRQTVDYLNSAGHDVVDLRKTPQEGLGDEKIWTLVRRQKRLLITTDKGFLARRQEMHYGLLVILLRRPNSQKIHEKVVQAIQHFEKEEWPGMAVVMRDRVMTTWKREIREDK